ncbi:MAG TPA: ABC transporter permease [bacterium]|nr:ABC transporter permease [bacterium]
MWSYFLRRLLLAIPTVLGAVTLVFCVMRVIPGDPVALFIPPDTPGSATAAVEARIRHEYGFDRPLYQQYAQYLRQMATGDFGRSIRQNTLVSADLRFRVPNTLELGVPAFALSIVFGIALGTLSAVRRGTWMDNAAMFGALFGVSVPDFWLALMLILLFALRFPLLPPSGWGGPIYTAAGIQHLVLPAVVLGLGGAGALARYTRSSMLEVINHDYVRTARAKGLREAAVITRHVLRTSLPTIITLLGLGFGRVLGGTVIVETVFGWPGVGRYLVSGINGRDYPVVQAAVLLVAVSFVVANLVTDLILVYVDPRIRYS